MREGLTEVVMLLDRSGSMSGLENDTIGGFNSMLARQKMQPGEAYLSVILFDNLSEVLYDRVDIREASPMSTATRARRTGRRRRSSSSRRTAWKMQAASTRSRRSTG